MKRELVSASALALGLIFLVPASWAGPMVLWEDRTPRFRLVLPVQDARAGELIQSTFARYLREFYGIGAAVTADSSKPGLYIVAGTPESNPVMADLIRGGLRLTTESLGDEGFQLLTHESCVAQYVIL